MIQFKNVSKWYGDYLALDNINAQVKQGEVIVVCGPSGSGKSTLIRTVNRLEPIQQGEIYVEDTPVHTCSSIDELRSHIGFVFQQFNLFPHMNVLDNLTMAPVMRSEEHTSELQSLMRTSYAVFCLKKNNTQTKHHTQPEQHI